MCRPYLLIPSPRLARYRMDTRQSPKSLVGHGDGRFPGVQNETAAYAVISQYQSQHPSEPPIAPNFLGHLTENGRAMGVLLEKVNGEFASIEDQGKCEDRRLHGMGLIHGDINRYNFLVDSDEIVRMVDFEHAEDREDGSAREELGASPFELAEVSGRGGPTK